MAEQLSPTNGRKRRRIRTYISEHTPPKDGASWKRPQTGADKVIASTECNSVGNPSEPHHTYARSAAHSVWESHGIGRKSAMYQGSASSRPASAKRCSNSIYSTNRCLKYLGHNQRYSFRIQSRLQAKSLVAEETHTSHMIAEKSRQGCIKLLVSLVPNVAAAQYLASGANKGAAYEAGRKQLLRRVTTSRILARYLCHVPLYFSRRIRMCHTRTLFEVGFGPRE